jgi:ribonuclease R
MVCDMVVNAEGEVHGYQFYPAVINSHARLTYTEVAAILGNTRGPEAQKRTEIVPHLLHLHEVYRTLLKARAGRGAIDFDTTETQIVCDDNGRIAKIVPRTRTEAHRLIEEAMLAANVCSADFIMRAKHPSLYRVHEGPTPEKRNILKNYLKAMGLGLSLSDDPKPGEFQSIAQATKDRPDATQIHTMLLRSMQQAIYTPINSGHFGLAYEAYTHFTSPIRRYPDLLVHRVIKSLLGEVRYGLKLPDVQHSVGNFKRKPGGAKPQPAMKTGKGKGQLSPQEAAAWETVGIHCSANERRADEASRDVEAWLKCMFMRERLGEEYGGTVTAATSFGLFVQLDGLYVEGLIHITELGGEYYRFDEARQELRGERTGVRYGVGARVRVQVSRVDLDTRKIDFRMVKEGEEARPVPAGNGGGRRRGRDGGEGGFRNAQDELAAIQVEDRAAKRAVRAHAKSGGGKPSGGKQAAAEAPAGGEGVRASKPSGKKPARKAGGKPKAPRR